jgi:hypothetical protein
MRTPLLLRSRSPETVTAISLAALALLTGLAAPRPAYAQAEVDRATARTLGQDGEKALEAKDYKKAEDDFRRADSLVHAPTLLLGLARSLAGEGRFVEASETYKRIVREGVAPGAPPAFQKAVDAAGQEVNDITPKLGAVTITVKGADGTPVPGLTVTFDGTPVNAAALGVKRPADPGAHTVHAAANGYKAADVTVNVTPGGAADAPLSLQKDPNAMVAPGPTGATPAGTGDQTAPAPAPSSPAPSESPPSGQKSILPWVAFGVGGAGLVVGGVTGVLAIGKHSDLSGPCSNGTCPQSSKSDLDSYHTLGTIATVGFVVAGVGAAAGVTLLLVQPKGAADAAPAQPPTGLRVVPFVGPGSVGATGTF